MSNIDKIEIETAVTGLIISESDDNQFYASLEQVNQNDKHALTIINKESNGTLKLEVVKQQKSTISFIGINGLNNFKSKLLVKIPKKYLGSIKIETTTGQTNIENVAIERLAVESTTGGLKLNHVNSKEIELESTTGSIHVNNVVADNLKAESTTGSIHLDSQIKKLNIESTTGSIHLKQDDITADSKLYSTTGSIHVSLHNQPQSLRVKFNSSTGKAHISKKGYNSIQNSKNEHEFQFGDGQTSLIVETTTGSFHFN